MECSSGKQHSMRTALRGISSAAKGNKNKIHNYAEDKLGAANGIRVIQVRPLASEAKAKLNRVPLSVHAQLQELSRPKIAR